MSLRRRLAEFGFESNDDYTFQIDCLMRAEIAHLRTLHIAGESGRRKTALANALAQALDFPRILYHDFAQPEPAAAPIIITSSEDGTTGDGPQELPPTAFARYLTNDWIDLPAHQRAQELWAPTGLEPDFRTPAASRDDDFGIDL